MRAEKLVRRWQCNGGNLAWTGAGLQSRAGNGAARERSVGFDENPKAGDPFWLEWNSFASILKGMGS